MKKLFLILAFLLLTSPSIAASLTFAWDPAPAGQTWDKVILYERTGAAIPYTYTKVGEVAGNLTTITISNVTHGIHTYIARSTGGGWESADSNSVSTGAVPSAPGQLKITIVVTVQP